MNGYTRTQNYPSFYNIVVFLCPILYISINNKFLFFYLFPLNPIAFFSLSLELTQKRDGKLGNQKLDIHNNSCQSSLYLLLSPRLNQVLTESTTLPPHHTQLSIKSKQVCTSPTSTYDTFLEFLCQDLSKPAYIGLIPGVILTLHQ